MATMYPAMMQEESINKSKAETIVFEYLRDNTPSSWHVIHSFRIPHHNKVLFGECDFIVIAPHYGIAFLEVKGGGVGVLEDGRWTYRDRTGKVDYKNRGPFEQARDGMFDIETIITELISPKFNRNDYVYTYGVIFVDESRFPIHKVPEDEDWRLVQNNTPERDYCSFVKKLCNHQKQEAKEVFKNSEKCDLTEEDAKSIAKGLRPSIECIAPVRSYIDYSEQDIIKLTEEQLECLDDIELNQHIVVLGGAGTGKTQIAVQDAQMASRDNKVCVICYNNLLKNVLDANLKNCPNVDVYTLHGLMTNISGLSISKDLEGEKRKEFFETELPERATSVLKNTGAKYQKIIVDEFQDICKKQYLEFLDSLLENGLSDGVFSFYADFSRQAIFGDVSLSLLDNYAFYSKRKLSINCRNTRFIGNEMINISGFDDKSYKLKITGEPVDYITYKDLDEEKNKLIECIKKMKENNVNERDVVILSPYSRKKSIVNVLDPNSLIIADYGKDSKGCFAVFSSIKAFKGLDSKIVIIADVDDYSDKQLMYVALSRARSKLFVLESKAASKQRKELLAGR